MNLDCYRVRIEQYYANNPTGCGGSFGEVLCYELHSQPDNPRGNGEKGLTFSELAEKWGISVTLLGLLIADHCARLEDVGIYPFRAKVDKFLLVAFTEVENTEPELSQIGVHNYFRPA